MEPLTQAITLLRPRALLWKQLDARGPWAVRFPRLEKDAVFCFVAQGECVCEISGRPEISRLREGDFLLMVAPKVWRLRSVDEDLSGAADLIYEHPTSLVTELGGGRGPLTRILGARFAFEATSASLLESLMPSVIEVRGRDGGSSRVANVLNLVGDEAASDRTGKPFVLERLLELLLVEAIRSDSHAVEIGERRGLAAGLADTSLAPVLQALHGDLRRNWTVEQLADEAGMSRSVFAERFTRVVGASPIDYLLRWRMSLAKEALRRGGESLTEVAIASGYQSVSSFSTAFTRIVGCPPSRFAAAGRAAGADVRPAARKNGREPAPPPVRPSPRGHTLVKGL